MTEGQKNLSNRNGSRTSATTGGAPSSPRQSSMRYVESSAGLKTELYPFQREASKAALEEESYALFMEQGTGKTIILLSVIAARWATQKMDDVLIVCPKSVVSVWQRQIAQHLDVPSEIYTNLETYSRASYTHPATSLKFLILNYERVWRVVKQLVRMPWDIVVSDETHRIRHRNTKQSKALYELGKASLVRLAATGTPIGSDERDLFAIFRFLKPDVFGTRWANFEQEYMVRTWVGPPDRRWPELKMQPTGSQRILQKVRPYVHSVRAKDALGLPSVTDQSMFFNLTGQAHRAYKDLETKFMYEYGDLTSTTPLVITQMLRLHQVTGGHLNMDDGTQLQFNRDKLKMLDDWLTDFPATEKLVMFARFTAEIDDLCELMRQHGRSFAVRDGRTSAKDMNQWEAFQDKDDPSTYIAQIASGGVGIDLFRARVGVFYSNSFSLIDYEQARARLIRHGQTRPVVFIHLIAQDTIDNDVFKLLYDKSLTANRVLRSLQERRTHGT